MKRTWLLTSILNLAIGKFPTGLTKSDQITGLNNTEMVNTLPVRMNNKLFWGQKVADNANEVALNLSSHTVLFHYFYHHISLLVQFTYHNVFIKK